MPFAGQILQHHFCCLGHVCSMKFEPARSVKPLPRELPNLGIHGIVNDGFEGREKNVDNDSWCRLRPSGISQRVLQEFDLVLERVEPGQDRLDGVGLRPERGQR
jgi:hypothetical protein